MNEGKIQKIAVSSIDFSNNKFKISKNNLSAELTASIKVSGILRPPAAARNGKKFYLLTGHNRASAAALEGFNEIPVFVIDEKFSDVIVAEAALKAFHGEIGPSGKLKFITLLKNEFNMDEDSAQKTGRDTVGIPEWVLKDNSFISDFMELNQDVKDFLDMRDIPFKLIKTFLELPSDAAVWLGGSASVLSLGVNLFKKMTELLIDIARRDGHCNFLNELNIDDNPARDAAQELMRKIFEFRYPEYSELKKRADERLRAFSKAGVLVEFPEFFEGGEMNIRIPINKKEGAAAFRKKTQLISEDELQKLLDML